MTKPKKLTCVILSLSILLSLVPGITLTTSAIAYNEVAGPRSAGDLTAYIYGDFVTEGDLPSPFGHVNPWSAFDWLTDGETITLAYSGPSISTAGTDFEGMGEYGYLGTAQMPSGTGMGNIMMVLLGEAQNDVRVYFYNLTENDVNVSFHIQSISNAGFSAHSIASVVTPDGVTALDTMDADEPDQNLSADFEFTLAPYTGTAPSQYNGDSGDQESVRPADDPETGFAPAGCFYISLKTQPNLGNDPSAGVIISNFFAGGDSDELAEITLEAPHYGSYTATAVIPDSDPAAAEGATVTVTETVTAGGEDKSFSYLPANGFTLSASGDNDYNFDFWSNGDNVLSYESGISTRAYGSGSTVVANFLPKTQVRAFDVNGTRYISWVEAVSAAQGANAPIILKKDYSFASTATELAAKGDTLANGVLESDGGAINYILPSGVKFLVPYNDQDTGSFADGPGFSVAVPGEAYKILTVPAGVTFTVNGKLNINACAYANNATSFMGGAAGDYGFISLDGTLNVENGGELRTYGYIAGPGRVNVNSGGTSYEVLQMTDWGGGSNAMSWNNAADDNLEKSFYFSQYYVQNVESDYRVYSGAMAYVYGHLTASMGNTKVLANVPAGFIGEGDTLFTMANGYIERRFNGPTDRITYDVHGDMTAKAITVDVLSIATVASAKWLLGLTNNMDIIASEGTTTLQYGYMVLPDTRIVVEENAGVVIADTAKVHIWRLDDWQNGYVGGPSNKGKKIVPIRYTVANGTEQIRTEPTHSGVLEVYGTVEAYSNVFTTNNGGVADDMVIRGTGTIINHPGSASSGLYILESSASFEQIQTLPVLGYMYGETDVSSFENGTYHSKTPEVDTHGNGEYDSWYQWQVDYTLTDENNSVIHYTDYAYNSNIDLDGTLIVDGQRYLITGVTSITDTNDNDLSSAITYDGNHTIGGVASNKNVDIADGWEFIDFHGIDRNIKIALTIRSYDHRIIWIEPEANKTTASYIKGNAASYAWDQDCAVEAVVTPADGATAAAIYGKTTTLTLSDITEDVEVSMTANADSWPVTVNVTYPDNAADTVTIFSTQINEVWTAIYAPEKPADGWYVIDSVEITGSNIVGYQNNTDILTVTGVNTSGVVVNVTLAHKDYKVTYTTDGPSLAPSFVNSEDSINLANSALGSNYVFGDASITTSSTAATVSATPTNLALNGIDKDLAVNVSVLHYDYVVTADGQTKYVEIGDDAVFTLEPGYALNGATVSNGTGTVSYTNPIDPTGTATITVSGIGSDVDVSADKVHFDAVVIFKDTSDVALSIKYYGQGSTVTYTATDEGVGGARYYISDASCANADVTFTATDVSVMNVDGGAAEVIVDLTAFTYKVTWNDGVEIKTTFLTGTENSATYYPIDEGVGGARYIIQSGYGEHAGGATNSYPASNGKSQFTVANINSDESVTLALTPFIYKIVFTDQDDNVLKTQYANMEDEDVTVSVGDKSIRFNVAGLDFTSLKNTVIAGAEITGAAIVNGGAAIGEGVQLVTLTGIDSDVTAKLEVYEYDHKIIVVLNDYNGWSSETEIHYVEGDSYSWSKPEGAEYVIDSFMARSGSASRNGDTVTIDLTGVTDVEAELDITTKLVAERLKIGNFINATGTSTKLATVTVTDSAYGVFTVECAKACVIAIDNGDGTYTRLTAVPTENANVYQFSCPANFSDDISIVVAVKGDVNGDGNITVLDRTYISRGLLQPTATAYLKFEGLTRFVADMDENGSFNVTDRTRLSRALLQSDKAAYLAFSW